MASEKTKTDPSLAAQVKKAAATAKHEVLSRSSRDALLNATTDELIAHNPAAEVIKGNANRSGCWQHAPAMFELFAAAEKRLTRVAEWDGMQVKQVERVQAFLLKGTKLLIIKTAPEEDLSALPVNHYAGSSAWINMITLLGEAGLMVETGYRERFDVAYIPKESPLWPGLVIDLSQPKARRQESGKKKDGEAAAAGKKAEGEASGKKAEGQASGKMKQGTEEPDELDDAEVEEDE